MDVLDLKILRHMGWRPFDPRPRGPDALRPPSIARSLGVSVDTVKTRVRRLEDAGVIRGYETHPNLHLLGLRQTTLHFRLPEGQKRSTLAKIERTEGVACVYDFVDEDLCVDVNHLPGADLARRTRLLEELTGAKALRFYVRPSPPTQLRMSRLDWRVLRALRGRALAPLAEVAAGLRVSARTVKRRFRRMLDGDAFDMGPILDPGKIESFVPVAINCRYAAGQAAPTQRLLRAFDDRLLYSWWPASPEIGDYELFVYATSLAEIEDLRGRALAVGGLEEARTLLPVLVRPNEAWVNEAIEARIAAAA